MIEGCDHTKKDIRFNIVHDKIFRVPYNLGKFTEVRKLSFQYWNFLQSLPSSIEAFEKLLSFNLMGCKLQHLPDVLPVKSLLTLDLTANGLTRVPSIIGKYESLAYLALNNNPIEVLSSNILNCKSLYRLDLY